MTLNDPSDGWLGGPVRLSKKLGSVQPDRAAVCAHQRETDDRLIEVRFIVRPESDQCDLVISLDPRRLSLVAAERTGPECTARPKDVR